jgi:hypothetical protein
VYEQIEQQAATGLVGVEVESAVDRSRLVKIGYVLVALVALGAVYALVSPKNPFKTVSRVFMPWADIAPPTSTVIDEVEPGNTQAFRGQQVTVRARVAGLPADTPVLLYYTTADRQIVDRAVEMARPANEYRHIAVLPAGDAALQQSLTYRIEAGDARTPDFEISVVAAPTIVVQAVEYKYPPYTGLIGQRVEHQGDLKALEGTEVTLEGLANQPIDKAYIDFDANGSLDLSMRADGTTARANFRLLLSEDRQKPQHELYQLLFKNVEGQQNPQPVRHRIEVVADLPPEIQFVEPRREEIEVPLDGSAPLELVASDPDFSLAEVRLVLRHADKSLLDEKLLNAPWRGQFAKKERFSPRQYQLAAGDVVEYYAVAVDNKSPQPNRTETSRRRIRISSPTGRGDGDQLAQDDSGGEQRDSHSQSQSGTDGQRSQDEQQNAHESDQKQAGEGSSPEDTAARNQREAQPKDPPQTAQSADGQNQSSDDQAQADQQAGEQSSARDRQGDSGEQQPQDSQNTADQQQSGEQSGAGKSSEGDSQQGGQNGSKQQDNAKHGGAERADEQSKDQQAGGQSGQKSGDQQSSDEQGGNEQRSGQQGSSGSQQSKGSARDRGQQTGQQGRGQTSNNGSSEQQPPESVASDGTNDGDAIERILKHRDQQTADENASNRSRGQDRQNRDGSKGDRQAARSQNQPNGKQAGQQNDSGQHGKDQGDGQHASGQKSPGKSAANESSNRDEQSANNTQDKQQQNSSDAKSTSGNTADQRQAEQPSSTNDQSSDQQGASDAGERPGESSEAQPGQKQQLERAPGEGQQATENQVDNQPGEKQQQGARAGNHGKQGATRDNNTREDGTPQDTNTTGQGAQSKDDPTRAADQQSEQSGEQRPDAKGGDGEQEKGQSGAGKKSNDNAGSPRPQESSQPRQKSQQPMGGENSEEKPEGNEQSPSTSKRESDSSGEQDGDRSGGGEQGGGQKANQAGTGGAGQNTAADEGAGQSDEAGDGDTSDRAGSDRQSQDQTGQKGQQPGHGSETQAGGQKQSGGDQAPSQPTGEPSDNRSGNREGAGTPGGEQGGANTPQGAGGPLPDQQWKPGVDRAADPNLEYTRKATDLAIEHLKDQLSDGRDDSELLKELGWTRAEADNFLQRWESMRRESQSSGPKGEAARRELDATLRSLGLSPRGSAIRSGGTADDRAAGLQESRRTTPPPEYSESFKAYTQGTARGGK